MKKTKVKQLLIDNDVAGQRIDNFLHRYLKTIPKSRIYQMIRKGEVRINKGRVQQTYKLQSGDTIRIPPVHVEEEVKSRKPSLALQELIKSSIIYEDDALTIINKPSALAVHSGTNQLHGVIDVMRELFTGYELVHRLDRDTSGCLMLAKNRQVLRLLNDDMKTNKVKKHYVALLAGKLANKSFVIDKPLFKNRMQGGERIVRVSNEGKKALTKFNINKVYSDATLVDIELVTGRTHQIRVHSADMSNPVLGDNKYGDKYMNKKFKHIGLNRLFLHAASLEFYSPAKKKSVKVSAPLDDALILLLEKLN